MKLSAAFVVLCLGVAKLTDAARPVSTEVVQKLKDLEPVYKQLQDKVISEVANAKLATATATDLFYKNVITEKESSLSRAIKMEDDVLNQINAQAPSSDSSCLDFVRGIMDNNMNLAGITFTNCVNNVEVGVNGELDKVYQLLQVDESELFDISLLDVFKGENIIFNPTKIIGKLDEKRAEIDGISLSFVADINSAVGSYNARLGDLQNVYKACLLDNEVMLKNAVDNAVGWLKSTC